MCCTINSRFITKHSDLQNRPMKKVANMPRDKLPSGHTMIDTGPHFEDHLSN